MKNSMWFSDESEHGFGHPLWLGKKSGGPRKGMLSDIIDEEIYEQEGDALKIGGDGQSFFCDRSLKPAEKAKYFKKEVEEEARRDGAERA